MKYEIDCNILRELQLVQLEILIEFDRICKENNLNYQLFAGTLLGAIRHEGFIPWDDDIDVCMLREDYEKFLVLADQQIDNKYFLQNRNTDKNFPHIFTRLRKNNTICLQEIFADIDMHHGIFIDIFPMDNIQLNSLVGRIQPMLLNRMKNLRLLRIKQICLSYKSFSKRYFAILAHWFLKLIPKNWTDQIENSILNMFNNINTNHVAHLTLANSKTNFNKYIMRKKDFYEVIEMEFEGYSFPVPKNYESVLIKLFNDYMLPPPEIERKPHHGIIKIVFNNDIN